MATIENGSAPQAKIQKLVIAGIITTNFSMFGYLYWQNISIFQNLAIGLAAATLLSIVEISYIKFAQKLRQNQSEQV